jgi:hypothetical protein
MTHIFSRDYLVVRYCITLTKTQCTTLFAGLIINANPHFSMLWPCGVGGDAGSTIRNWWYWGVHLHHISNLWLEVIAMCLIRMHWVSTCNTLPSHYLLYYTVPVKNALGVHLHHISQS